MLRPSGSIVLPFKIKKASLALRIESLFEKTFSMGISYMSLAVWLGEDRKCCATVVGLDLVLGLSMVRLKKAGLASRNIVHKFKTFLRCVGFCFSIVFIFLF